MTNVVSVTVTNSCTTVPTTPVLIPVVEVVVNVVRVCCKYSEQNEVAV